jgi:hypothetical protein
MATVAGGVSTQGVVVSTLDEVAMAAAVAVMAILEVLSFRGDATVRDLAAAGLGTEKAGDIKVMAILVLEGAVTLFMASPVDRRG